MKLPLRQAIPRKSERMQPEVVRAEADDLAADILAYLAEDEARILRFFDLTGLTPSTLRQAAGRPDFSTSILDYLASDDRLLLAFAAARRRDPARIEALRLRLGASSDEST